MANELRTNRRHVARFPADLLVRVYLYGRAVGSYRTRDVSRAGVGLHAGRVMLWRGMPVEVQLYSAVGTRAVPRRIAAVVCYCRGNGMGLRFRRR
ncbi:PilZ domain-containing protein [Arhodomonas sp. AD133]|uniref:PilZ domain-containing protein n=1 Tax=Arhodomonas sp. AD133 TaxID=3415009 RepID=UPI003EBA3EB8